MPLTNVRPAELVSTSISPQGSATFYWEVRPRQAGVVQGDIWVYVRFVPKAGGAETQIPVSVQQVRIRSGEMWGRSGSQARLLGAGGTLAGLVLALLARRRRPGG
jgi:hypothetical protein